jgi:hypothetical protein
MKFDSGQMTIGMFAERNHNLSKIGDVFQKSIHAINKFSKSQ